MITIDAISIPAQFDAINPSFNITPTKANCFLVVTFGMAGPNVNITISSVIDNASGGTNLYQQVPGAYSFVNGGDGEIFSFDIWYCSNSKANANQLSANLSAEANTQIVVYQLYGLNLGESPEAAVGISNGSFTGLSSFSTPPITTSAFSSFIVVVGDATWGFAKVALPWSGLPDANGNYLATTTAYLITDGPGTYIPTWQTQNTNNYAMSGASFQGDQILAFDTTPGTNIGWSVE